MLAPASPQIAAAQAARVAAEGGTGGGIMM